MVFLESIYTRQGTQCRMTWLKTSKAQRIFSPLLSLLFGSHHPGLDRALGSNLHAIRVLVEGRVVGDLGGPQNKQVKRSWDLWYCKDGGTNIAEAGCSTGLHRRDGGYNPRPKQI